MPRVHVEAGDDHVLVKLDDGKVNALSRLMLADLDDALAEAVGTGLPVVVTGNARTFSAGLDLMEVPTLDRAGLDDLLTRFHHLMSTMLTARVPVVAAVNGPAIAGGAILALACDQRIGAPEAPIGAIELSVGIPLPPSDIALFTSRLPIPTVRNTILRPRRVHGDEALRTGWLDALADDPVAAAVETAAALPGPNPVAFASLKANLNRPVLESWERVMKEGRDAYLDLLTSEETQEGVLRGITASLGG